MNKQFCAAMAASALLTTQAMAAGPLAPGKPAGVAKAQDATTTPCFMCSGSAPSSPAWRCWPRTITRRDGIERRHPGGGGGTTTTTTTTT